MRILAITASPKGAKSQTLKLTQKVIEGVRSAGAEVEIVDVCKLKINYCVGCGVCYAKGECFHKDDFARLYASILSCDGLVMSSPNYFRGVTAQLKTLLDRMADTVHCQLLTGKYGCAVGTAGGPEFGEVTDYLKGILIGFGVNVSGCVGASPMRKSEWEAAEKDAHALGIKLVEDIKSKAVYPEQEEAHQYMRKLFSGLVNMNKDLWAHEYEHWKKLGVLS